MSVFDLFMLVSILPFGLIFFVLALFSGLILAGLVGGVLLVVGHLWRLLTGRA